MGFVDEVTVGADLLKASGGTPSFSQGDPVITTPINAPTYVEERG
jgi:hypothetical protein